MTVNTNYIKNIIDLGISIYDPITIGDPNIWIPSNELESILNKGLCGLSVKGLPNRTRSKFIKQNVCEILGYPTPKRFTKTKPKFPGQNFDIYTQKANNLQVTNDELEVTRRYVVISVDENYLIDKVKVVTGSNLAKFDTTGKTTKKYQAKLVPSNIKSQLISSHDTNNLSALTSSKEIDLKSISPTCPPNSNQLMNIENIYSLLQGLIGEKIPYLGADQERNRGAIVHELVCKQLGYTSFSDDGQFPDIKHQLIEIKLQTSHTVDLGLVQPDSKEALDMSYINETYLRHCDVRYVLFYGEVVNNIINITNLYLTTGEDFFSAIPRFGGKVLNKKLQVILPKSFFD